MDYSSSQPRNLQKGVPDYDKTSPSSSLSENQNDSAGSFGKEDVSDKKSKWNKRKGSSRGRKNFSRAFHRIMESRFGRIAGEVGIRVISYKIYEDLKNSIVLAGDFLLNEMSIM